MLFGKRGVEGAQRHRDQLLDNLLSFLQQSAANPTEMQAMTKLLAHRYQGSSGKGKSLGASASGASTAGSKDGKLLSDASPHMMAQSAERLFVLSGLEVKLPLA